MELYHHGVKGMKWGLRRWQNNDGSLTPAGRKHYGVGEARTPLVDRLTKRYYQKRLDSVRDKYGRSSQQYRLAKSKMKNSNTYIEAKKISKADKTKTPGRIGRRIATYGMAAASTGIYAYAFGSMGLTAAAPLSALGYVAATGINSVLGMYYFNQGYDTARASGAGVVTSALQGVLSGNLRVLGQFANDEINKGRLASNRYSWEPNGRYH